MKISWLASVLLLSLLFSFALAGCRSKPQQSKVDNTSSADGAQEQSGQQSKNADKGLDEAARIIAEAMKPKATPNGTPQNPASIILNATPTPPPLGVQAGLTGRPFTSFDGRFIVTPPPGFPAFQSNTVTLSDVNIEIHKFISESAGSGSTIIVAYYDLPESVAGRAPQETLDRARDGALKEVHGRLEKQENLTVKEYPAQSVYLSADLDSGKPVYGRFLTVLKQRRVYLLTHVTLDRAELERPESEAYFKSLTLLD